MHADQIIQPQPRRVLAFDTSIAHCGWAVLDEGVDLAPPRHVASHCYETEADMPIFERVYALGRFARILIDTYSPTHLIVEEPMPWAGKGVQGKDNIVKQAMAYATLGLVCRGSGLAFETHLPSKWKGKSPKDKHVDAFKRIVQLEPRRHDQAEAFSYGWWYLTGQNAAKARS